MIVRIYTGHDGQTHFEELPLPAEEGKTLRFRRAPTSCSAVSLRTIGAIGTLRPDDNTFSFSRGRWKSGSAMAPRAVLDRVMWFSLTTSQARATRRARWEFRGSAPLCQWYLSYIFGSRASRYLVVSDVPGTGQYDLERAAATSGRSLARYQRQIATPDCVPPDAPLGCSDAYTLGVARTTLHNGSNNPAL